MRRLVALFIILLIVAAAWSGGWFWLASWADRNTSGALAEIEERGINVDCAERDVVGFPFAFKMACGETSIVERRTGTSAQLGGLTGGASVLAPRTASITLASPARIESPMLVGPADLRWDDAEIAVGMGLSGPQTVSFGTTQLQGTVPLPGFPQAEVSAASADGTLAPAEDGGTLADVSFAGLSITGAGTTLPDLDGRASAFLSVPPRALLAGRAGLQAPVSARDINVSVRAGEARIDAAGELSVDAEGILDGTITLRIAGSQALVGIIGALPAGQQKIGNAIAGGMLAFGKSTTLDGETASELVVEIVRGRAKVGPVEVGLPRLPL